MHPPYLPSTHKRESGHSQEDKLQRILTITQQLAAEGGDASGALLFALSLVGGPIFHHTNSTPTNGNA